MPTLLAGSAAFPRMPTTDRQNTKGATTLHGLEIRGAFPKVAENRFATGNGTACAVVLFQPRAFESPLLATNGNEQVVFLPTVFRKEVSIRTTSNTADRKR